jgi:hypothetical protein
MILRGISMQNWLAAALQVVPPPREADGKPAQDQAPPQEEPAPEEVGSWGKGGEQMQTRRGGRGGGGGGRFVPVDARPLVCTWRDGT